MRRAGARGLVVALIVGLAACSSGGGSASSTSSVASSVSSSASAPSTTTTSTPPTTTTTTPSCDAAPLPAGAVRVSSGSGDLDGDGQTDALSVFADGTETAPGPWHVLVTLGNGKGRVQGDIGDAVNGDANQRIALLGASTITGAKQALFASIGSGASTAIVGVFVLDDCGLTRLSIAPSIEPAQFPIGGTVTHLGGLRCADGGLDRMEASSSDGTTYATKVQRFTLSGSMLTADGAPATESLSGADPTLQSFGTLDCPGVQSP